MWGLSRAVHIRAPGNLGRTPKVLPVFGRDKARVFGPEQRSVLEDWVHPLLTIQAPQSIRPPIQDILRGDYEGQGKRRNDGRHRQINLQAGRLFAFIKPTPVAVN